MLETGAKSEIFVSREEDIAVVAGEVSVGKLPAQDLVPLHFQDCWTARIEDVFKGVIQSALAACLESPLSQGAGIKFLLTGLSQSGPKERGGTRVAVIRKSDHFVHQ